MLLCYDDDQAWEEAGEEALAAAMQEAVQLTHELDARGQYITAAPLHPVSTATSVRVRDGKRLVTDGPFAETREHLGGFYLIEARDLDEAIGIAARHPGARAGTVEIRPVDHRPADAWDQRKVVGIRKPFRARNHEQGQA
jgi:hypothetical protein